MEIANIHVVFAHVAENITGWFQGLRVMVRHLPSYAFLLSGNIQPS